MASSWHGESRPVTSHLMRPGRGGRCGIRRRRSTRRMLGGTTVMPVTDFGGAVTIAMFNDPDGLLVGLVRAAAQPAQGTSQPRRPVSGAPVTWFEILGPDAPGRPALRNAARAALYGSVDDPMK